MLITDLIFIFLFLPAALILFYVCPKKAKEYILLAVSLVFYACGSADYFIGLLISLAVNIGIGYAIGMARKQTCDGAEKSFRIPAQVLLAVGVCYNIGILGYYKYTDFALRTIGRLTHTEPELKNLILPLGLSFFTFKAVSYLADVYRGRIQAEKNPVRAALYLSFFAQIQSGPLSRYEDMYQEDKSEDGQLAGFRVRLRTAWDHIAAGTSRFVIGFNKKILIANILANMVNEIFGTPSEQVTVLYAWTGMICYSIQLFFDFSGYSDMAVGISRMFGYHCPENFDYPYMTPSVAQFWRRWHMTLGSWFRDYIYFPLGGSRVKSRLLLYRNLFAVWMFTGLWHGADWNFICWGIGYFAAIAFEKTTGFPEKIPSVIGKWIYRAAALLFINVQWVMFRAEGFVQALQYLKNLFFGVSNATVDARALFLIRDNLFFLLLGIFLCFPVMPWLEKKLGQHKYGQVIWGTGFVLVNGFLFLWALSYVVAGQNNPFAYAFF